MEGHFGLTVDIVTMSDDTKRKVIEIRNNKINGGDPSFTMNDVITLGVNMLYELEALKNAGASKLVKKEGEK